jgi:SSS family solute:Na+ symporter
MVVILFMAVKGVLASLAGPAPDYDMQRILATRKPAGGVTDERRGSTSC